MSDFKVVKSKRRLTKDEVHKKQAWRKFRAGILPLIAKQYVADSADAWMKEHPNDDRKKAEAWAERDWKACSGNPKRADEFEERIRSYDSRAAEGAWKTHKLGLPE